MLTFPGVVKGRSISAMDFFMLDLFFLGVSGLAWRCCWPFWSLLGLSGLDFGGFGRSFSKFLVFIFFTISKLFKPNIDFGV